VLEEESRFDSRQATEIFLFYQLRDPPYLVGSRGSFKGGRVAKGVNLIIHRQLDTG
jgi:hypothetical protein